MQRPVLGKGLGSLLSPSIPISKTEEIILESKKDVFEISVSQIVANTRQPRSHFQEEPLNDLVESIRIHGILQPLIVTKTKDGYELIAGERRLRASRILGLKMVPVIVRDVNEQQKLELAIIENVQRENLNAIEEGFAIKALMDDFSLTQEEVSKRLGKSRSTLANTVRLLELPDEMRLAIIDGRMSKSHGRELLSESDPKKQRILFEQILSGSISTKTISENVSKKQVHQRKKVNSDVYVSEWEKRLREVLGTKVEIQEKEGKGKIIISYYSREDLKQLLNTLQA